MSIFKGFLLRPSLGLKRYHYKEISGQQLELFGYLNIALICSTFFKVPIFPDPLFVILLAGIIKIRLFYVVMKVIELSCRLIKMWLFYNTPFYLTFSY